MLETLPSSPAALVADIDALDADAGVLHQYQDGVTNVAFIGPLGPLWDGGQDLLEAFAHYHHCLNPRSRLYLVLPERPCERELAELQRAIDRAQLTEACACVGGATPAELKAYYLIAHAFLCVSRQETVVPYLLLALYYQTPIVAWAVGPVAEVLGDELLTWEEFRPALLAQSLRYCLEDRAAADYLRQRQRARYNTVCGLASSLH
jgi:glycosyltransferase involved in cell wall biosynthesis